MTGGAAVAQTPGSAVEGGAVLDDGGGPVTITNAAITGNTAAGSSGGAGGYGGAIDVEPPSNVAISLTNTTLSGNQAGGSSTADSGHGGAIDNQGPGTITLNHVSMTGNHAGGHQAGGYGGAANTEGPLVVSASTFTDNTAGGDGHFGYGGALDASTVTSTDSTFRGNDAGGGGASGDGHGGALELGVSATLTRSAIADNRAGGGGDGTGFGADATFNTPAAPKLSKLRVHGRRVSYRDTEPGLAKFSVFAGHTKLARFSHRGIAGHNRFKFKKHLQPGAYVLKAIAYNSFGSPSKRVIKHFQVKG